MSNSGLTHFTKSGKFDKKFKSWKATAMSRGMSKCRQGICWTGDSVMSRSVGCLVWSLKMVWHALHSAIKTTHIRRRKVDWNFEDEGNANFSMNAMQRLHKFLSLTNSEKFFNSTERVSILAITKRISTIVLIVLMFDNVTKTMSGWTNVWTFDDKRWWGNEASDLRIEFKSKIGHQN